MWRDPAQVSWSLRKDGDGAPERKDADIYHIKQKGFYALCPCCSQPHGKDVLCKQQFGHLTSKRMQALGIAKWGTQTSKSSRCVCSSGLFGSLK